MPDTLQLTLTVPAELGLATAVISELRDQVRGMNPYARPSEHAPGVACWVGVQCARSRGATARRAWSPGGTCGAQVAGRSKWARVEALLRNRVFVTEYARACERMRTGETAVFPPGTYWLRRFASVPVLET